MSLTKATEILLEHGESASKRRSIKPGERPSTDEGEVKFALNYLDHFGYTKRGLSEWKDITIGDILAGLKKFQGLFGLARSGTLGARTIKAMEAPRCGCPDFAAKSRDEFAGFRRMRDLAASMLPAWKKRGVTYAIDAYVPGIEPEAQNVIFATAFSAWTLHGNIEVSLAASKDEADIVISTDEGPRSNFDGAGGTLAWAYLPDGSDQQLQMKFDSGETWTDRPEKRGIALLNVACHEFGHLLGLDHSHVQGALMAPYYNATVAAPQMDDDVPRFQSRYGSRG